MGYHILGEYPMISVGIKPCQKEEVISLYNTSLHLNDCGAEFVWEKPENQR